jgi:hypothetical protein
MAYELSLASTGKAVKLCLRYSISQVVQFGHLIFKKCDSFVQSNGAMGSLIRDTHHDPQLIN